MVYEIASRCIIGKESACQWRRCSLYPWVGKVTWRRKWQPTPVFLLGNPMDRGEWRATVHGVAKSKIKLSNWACTNVVYQIRSVTQSYPTLFNPMNPSTPGLPVHHKLLEFTQTHVHRVSDAISYLIFCCPLLLLPQVPPSIRVFSNESTLRMRWTKYWSFSFSIIPSKEIPGLISFRMDWLDLLAVQGTLKSLLQHHSSKASILRRSAFFTVQLSHPYMTTGKP